MTSLNIEYRSGLLDEICYLILNNSEILVGDVLEFGTGTAHSTVVMAASMPNKRIITFDGFQGLPKTCKPVLPGWHEGSFKYDEAITMRRIVAFPNVEMNKTIITEKSNPADYKVTAIAGVNMDFDLYEGTLAALRFCGKCSWKSIVVRFDDWGAYDFQNPALVDAHEKAALSDYITETGYTCSTINYGNVKMSKHGPLHAIVRINR